MFNNILITSAGKRVELLLEFKKELKSVFPNSQVLTVDMNPHMSPACRLSDGAFTVPPVSSPQYIECLLEICKENKIKLVIPTIDTELLILSENKDLFLKHGINIMVSDPEFISICRDKRKTKLFFDANGIKNPELRDLSDPVFPIFAKPYDGSLSTNIHIIHSVDELTPEIQSDPKLIFMEFIDKNEYKEFTVDLYYNIEGKLIEIVPRERIEIRSGEVNKGATRKNFIVQYIKTKMSFIAGARGCICIQLFYREKDNDVIGIEINPRFGGGYPLSYYSGANFPKYLIDEYFLNKSLEYTDLWRDNTVMLRYDSQVIFQE